MHQTGLDAFAKRDEERSRIYAYERENVTLDKKYEAKFRKNKKAWEFFESQPPSYKKPCINWIVSAKQEETRLRRLETLIKDSENGERIAQLRRNPQVMNIRQALLDEHSKRPNHGDRRVYRRLTRRGLPS